MNPLIRKHLVLYSTSIFLALIILSIFLWIGEVVPLMRCWSEPEPIQADCYVFGFNQQPYPFSNGCGFTTINYYVELLVATNDTRLATLGTPVVSQVCSSTWCFYATGGGCYTSSCGVWDNQCGPIVTTDVKYYSDMLFTTQQCFFVPAGKRDYEYYYFNDTVDLDYWTYLDKPSCNNFWNVTCFSIVLLIAIGIIVSPIYWLLILVKFKKLNKSQYALADDSDFNTFSDNNIQYTSDQPSYNTAIPPPPSHPDYVPKNQQYTAYQ